ncbi:hypothetical protein ONZ45_g9145 [Pleurotus djamor]|nr:hypothetical protein ONZ45_g9145 [Pleurotus djamor]
MTLSHQYAVGTAGVAGDDGVAATRTMRGGAIGSSMRTSDTGRERLAVLINTLCPTPAVFKIRTVPCAYSHPLQPSNLCRRPPSEAFPAVVSHLEVGRKLHARLIGDLDLVMGKVKAVCMPPIAIELASIP